MYSRAFKAIKVEVIFDRLLKHFNLDKVTIVEVNAFNFIVVGVLS